MYLYKIILINPINQINILDVILISDTIYNAKLLLWNSNIELIVGTNDILPNKKYKIHSGIYNMYINNDIDKNIIYILENLFKYFPKYRKIFTGHSKGSTNSVLLVLELLSKFNDKYKYEIYTFGSPQIFNYELGSFLHNNKNIKIFNIINKPDIITSIPLLNKYHIGIEITLKNDQIYITKHKNPYKINFFIKEIYSSIINHDLNIYIKNIFNNIL